MKHMSCFALWPNLCGSTQVQQLDDSGVLRLFSFFVYIDRPQTIFKKCISPLTVFKCVDAVLVKAM